jgi:hypothetical protein
MTHASRGHRRMAAWFCFALATLLVVFTAPASATFDPVEPVGGGGGGCATNCPQPQSSYVTGTATSGNASNQNNNSNFQLNYGVPNDPNSTYSGTYMIQIVDTNNNASVYTGYISDVGNSGSGYFSYGGLPTIPIGGSASITINESAPNGNSFQAGYVVNNFGQ